MEYSASHTLCQAATQPSAYPVASVAIPATGSTCPTPGHPLDPHPEDQKLVISGTEVNPDHNTQEKKPMSKPERPEKN